VNPENAEAALPDYFRIVHPGWEGVSVADLVDMTSGWETELYGFTLDFSEGGLHISRRLVARLYPGRFAAGKAVKEFSVMGRLREAGYPVPEVHEVETDAEVLGVPFMIMD